MNMRGVQGTALAQMLWCGIALGQQAPVDPQSPAQTAPGPAADAAQEPVPSVAVDTGTSEKTPVESSPRAKSRMIEEVVVTAQKREENLQDVPISINAFSAELLDAKGISDPKDLPLVTPGLTLGSQAGFTVTYLRGVGSDAFLLGDPSVALYIDGIYFPFAHGQAQNFGAIERIEVLKGPQGTLFGRNAVGGAISVITQAPSFAGTEASLQGSYSRFDNLETKAHVNIPILDNLAVAVSGIYNNADNYRDGTVGGHPLPQEISRGFRVKLRWDPIDRLDLTAAGFHLTQTGVTTMFATNSDPSESFGATIQPQTGYGGDNDAPDFFNLSNTVYYGQGVLNTDWFDVKLLGSYQHLTTNSLYDFDGSPQPLVFFHAYQLANVTTAEAQILSNADSWNSQNFNWIFGYYYFHGKQGLDPVFFGAGGSVFDQINARLAPLLDPLGLTGVQPNGELAATGVLGTDSNSLYAQATYHFTESLALTLGVRGQDEKRTIIDSSGAVVAPDGTIGPRYTDFHGNSDTTRSLSPKVSPELRLWDGGLLYFSFQQATKSSTYNVVNFLNTSGTPQLVKPEKLTAYELGLKTDLFDGTTRFSTAAFWYEIRDQQVQFISLLAGGAVRFETAPAARVRGFDFDLTSELFPQTLGGLVFTAGGAYLDAEYTDYPCGEGFDAMGVYSSCNDYTGNRIVRSPKVSGTVGLSDTFDAPGGSLEVATDYYYNSGFYYLAQNTAFNHEDRYGVMGAHVSYLYEPAQLRLTVFGKNILDEKYNYSRFTNDFGALDAVAPPAVYGIRVNWDFK